MYFLSILVSLLDHCRCGCNTFFTIRCCEPTTYHLQRTGNLGLRIWNFGPSPSFGRGLVSSVALKHWLCARRPCQCFVVVRRITFMYINGVGKFPSSGCGKLNRSWSFVMAVIVVSKKIIAPSSTSSVSSSWLTASSFSLFDGYSFRTWAEAVVQRNGTFRARKRRGRNYHCLSVPCTRPDPPRRSRDLSLGSGCCVRFEACRTRDPRKVGTPHGIDTSAANTSVHGNRP